MGSGGRTRWQINGEIKKILKASGLKTERLIVFFKVVPGNSLLNCGLEVVHKLHGSLSGTREHDTKAMEIEVLEGSQSRSGASVPPLPRERPPSAEARALALYRKVKENKVFVMGERNFCKTSTAPKRSLHSTGAEETLPAGLHHQMDTQTPSHLKIHDTVQMRKPSSLSELRRKSHLFHLVCEQ